MEDFRKYTIRDSIVMVASHRAELRGCGCCGGGCCAPPINERSLLRTPRLEYTPLSFSTPAAANLPNNYEYSTPNSNIDF